MKKHLLFTISIIGILVFANAQVLDYTTVNYPSTICNIFNSSPLRMVSGLKHYPVAGGVSYNGSALVLETMGNATPWLSKGTAYAIEIPIKKNFKYSFIVNMRIESADPVSTVILDLSMFNTLPDPNTSDPTACGSVNNNSWNVLQANIFTSNFASNQNSQNYQMAQNYTPNYDFSYLTVLAHGGSSSQPTKVIINSITITETAPNPSFTITQSSGNIPCGTATSKTFTVNNVYNSPGTLTYDWNLGPNNGWKYNGADAPATFSTTTNSITLVSSASAAAVANVSAIPKINGTAYPSITSSINFTSGLPDNIAINTPNSRCPSGIFSMNNLPNNATVTWQANPSNIVSFSNAATGVPITITKQSDGNVSIIATVAVNQCKQPISTNLFYGQYPTTGTYTVGGSTTPITAIPSVNYVPPSQIITLNLNNIGALPSTSFTIQKLFGNGYLNVMGNSANFSLGNYSAANPYNGTMTLLSSIATSCNTTTQTFSFSTKGQCGVCGSLFRVSPNPASDIIRIEELDSKTNQAKSESSVTAIELLDQMGNKVYHKKIAEKSLSSVLSIPVAHLKKELYTIRIFNGVEWDVQQVFIQR